MLRMGGTSSVHGLATAATTPLRECRWCHVAIPTGQRACPVHCTRCGAVCQPDAGRCPNPRCKCFRPHNQVARRTGIYSRVVPADLRLDADQLKDAIVSDLGGVDELSALEVSTVRKLADVEIMLRLLLHNIVQGGLLTPTSGRVRDVYPAFLAGVDRWDRLASRLGLKRRTKAANVAQTFAALHEGRRP